MKKYLNAIVILISLATMASGITQVAAPGYVLELIGATVTDTSAHFFAIIGMFMTLFGGLMLQALYSARPQHPAVLWSALQKLGAAIAVGLGMYHGIFGMIAGTVAVFDLFSGIVFLYYLKTMDK
ncbi:MAG: patatin [Cyclobacteriaceae bacterium]|nr:patatin [Cyclobacteriaceae bacterium]